MRNNQLLTTFSFAVFSILVFIVGVVTVSTYIYSESTNPILSFSAKHHVIIMLFSILISIGYGFFWSQLLLTKVKHATNVSEDMWSIVRQLLNKEEKSIIMHLQENNGKSTQAKISHIDNMGGVKAMRTVQKLEIKKLITVERQGKLRIIKLKKNIPLQ